MGRWQQESLSLPRCSHLFVLTRLRTLVPTWPTEFSIALLKKMYTLPYQGAAGGGKRLNYGSRLDVGLPPTKLLLRLTEQLLHVQQMVFVEATFPSTVITRGCLNKHVYYVTNCCTEVGEHPILFFLFFVEESSKRAAKTIACPCRKHVGGYTAGVCLNTNICLMHAPQRVARSRIVLSVFLQPIISYRVRLHDDFV